MRTLVSALKSLLVPAPTKGLPTIAAPAAAPAPSFAQELALLRAYDSHHISALEKEVNALRAKNRDLARLNANLEADVSAYEAQNEEHSKDIAGLKASLVHAATQASNQNTLANNRAADIAKLQETLDWQERMTDEAATLAAEGLRLLDIADTRARIMGNLYGSAKARMASRFTLPAVATEVTHEEVLYLALRQVEIDAEFEVLAPAAAPVVKFDGKGKYHCRQCRKMESRRGHRHGHVPMSPRELYHYLNR